MWRRDLRMSEGDRSVPHQLRASVEITQTADITTDRVLPHRAVTWRPTGVELKHIGWLRLDTGALAWELVHVKVTGIYIRTNGRDGKAPVVQEFYSKGPVHQIDVRHIRWTNADDGRTHEGSLPTWTYEILDLLPAMSRRPWSLILTEDLG